MRVFAGPNGSGKSVLKSYLRPELLGVYLNADDIEATAGREGFLDLDVFGVHALPEELPSFFARSRLLEVQGLVDVVKRFRFDGQRLDFAGIRPNSYVASVLVDFLRTKLLSARVSFTFETVMSHEGKVGLLSQARSLGYRTYLYYVATDDPAINISRVRNRVMLNGHDVPTEVIAPRYHRSLGLLFDAIRSTDRAYIFDNSAENSDCRQTWLAEVTGGRTLELKTGQIPAWFKRAVLDRIHSES